MAASGTPGLSAFPSAASEVLRSPGLRSVESRSSSLPGRPRTPTSPLRSLPHLRSTNSSERNDGVYSPKYVSLSDVIAGRGSDLPMKEIPGSYGIPFFGAIKDRLDFFWFQGSPKFYESRRDKYKSTVFRTNVPPGPPFFPDPRVIMLLDEKSYPALFDLSNVEKKDVFTGTYVPSLSLTGGYRVLPYLDPSEPKHAQLKQLAFEILKGSGPRIFPEFASAMAEVFTKWEATLKKDGKVAYVDDLRQGTFKFVLKSFTTQDPTAPGEYSLATEGPSISLRWVLASIGPITIVPVPWYLAPLVEIFLHTFPIPSLFVRGAYNKLLNFFRSYGTELLDKAEKLGLERNEALHNLVFIVIFNAWGGIDLLFPLILKRLGATSAEFQAELAAEVRKAMADNGGQLSPKALEAMPLVQSAVYEVLRIDPPVPYQYAAAKQDFVIQSHDALFQIKKGEVLAGFMPLATRDPKVFEDAQTYHPKRFLGDEGKDLLKYVLWSNGPQTEQPALTNKHCPGKNITLTIAHLFVATIYSKYDSIEIDATNSTNLSSLKRASS